MDKTLISIETLDSGAARVDYDGWAVGSVEPAGDEFRAVIGTSGSVEDAGTFPTFEDAVDAVIRATTD